QGRLPPGRGRLPDSAGPRPRGCAPRVTRASDPSVTPESAAPLGATCADGGVNFSVFSKHATLVDLLLFDDVDDARPARVIAIDPETNRHYHYWDVVVPGVRPGQIYGYRASGPFDGASGRRFDADKVLLDPYGRGVVVPKAYSRAAASEPGDNTAAAMKSVVVDPTA